MGWPLVGVAGPDTGIFDKSLARRTLFVHCELPLHARGADWAREIPCD